MKNIEKPGHETLNLKRNHFLSDREGVNERCLEIRKSQPLASGACRVSVRAAVRCAEEGRETNK